MHSKTIWNQINWFLKILTIIKAIPKRLRYQLIFENTIMKLALVFFIGVISFVSAEAGGYGALVGRGYGGGNGHGLNTVNIASEHAGQRGAGLNRGHAGIGGHGSGYPPGR